LALFDLQQDPGETLDVASEHPDVVERLSAQARLFEKVLKAEARPPGALPGNE